MVPWYHGNMRPWYHGTIWEATFATDLMDILDAIDACVRACVRAHISACPYYCNRPLEVHGSSVGHEWLKSVLVYPDALKSVQIPEGLWSCKIHLEFNRWFGCSSWSSWMGHERMMRNMQPLANILLLENTSLCLQCLSDVAVYFSPQFKWVFQPLASSCSCFCLTFVGKCFWFACNYNLGSVWQTVYE